MLGVFLVLVFMIPAMFVSGFWPDANDPNWWKIVAVGGCGLSASLLLPTYFYLAFRLTEYEARLERNPRESERDDR